MSAVPAVAAQPDRVELSCCTIAHSVRGQGPALVVLHSSSGVRSTPALDQLARHFTIYQPACPGFDASPPPDQPSSVPALADWLGEYIDTAIGTPVHLSGQSFGGWVAAWLAVRRPELVRSLVLQCPIGFGPLVPPPEGADAATLLARAHAHPERRPPETRPAAQADANRRMAAAYGCGVVTDHALLDRLARLDVRALIVHGCKDGIVSLESIRTLAECLPATTLVQVEDAAHNIEVDQPDAYARTVLGFLEEIA
ncbi:alpha/beta hydrolase [Variovorax guangxiensis]|uniref:alpha/beta fold hydrolase n=1 Tax=Variovorax guangxiensis TaxID=1775474 RepID=UPI00285C5CD4|nr:alpha/beta hydrolase [Variovorax guangxiensis]MDR6859470.1 pimeloyl-ACP methyl ester carboxylesterase [Variovorax guangxiensis]